jgi:hypothetical protein
MSSSSHEVIFSDIAVLQFLNPIIDYRLSLTCRAMWLAFMSQEYTRLLSSYLRKLDVDDNSSCDHAQLIDNNDNNDDGVLNRHALFIRDSKAYRLSMRLRIMIWSRLLLESPNPSSSSSSSSSLLDDNNDDDAYRAEYDLLSK